MNDHLVVDMDLPPLVVDLVVPQSGDEAQDEPGDGRTAEPQPTAPARSSEEPQRRQDLFCHRALRRRCEYIWRRVKWRCTHLRSSRLAPTRAYQDGLTLVCPEASQGGSTPSPPTHLALTTRNPTSERAPPCSETPDMGATTLTTAIARDFWQVTGLCVQCVLSSECCNNT